MFTKKPCKTCPYKLGLIKTFVNPCPQCEENNYETFRRFTGEWSEGEEDSGVNLDDLLDEE